MSKKSCQDSPSRIPEEVDGVQVNGCKNPTCPNFLGLSKTVPFQAKLFKKYNTDLEIGQHWQRNPHFRISGLGKDESTLICKACEARKAAGEEVGSVSSVIKSNSAVIEELDRISSYLSVGEPHCTNAVCPTNHGAAEPSFKKNGKTAAGNPRYLCLICKKSFTLHPKRRKHTRSEINRQLFLLLMHKMPLRRIASILGISPQTVYDKINFLHRQCQLFAARRERQLPETARKRLYLATDRQVQISNWSQRRDKRNCEMYGIATACQNTGYVFAFNFNFDNSVDIEKAEAEAIAVGDYDKRKHHRQFARIWLKQEFADAVRKQKKTSPGRPSTTLLEEIQTKAKLDAEQNQSGGSEKLDKTRRLPRNGVLIHNEYTMMAHFYLLRRLFAHVGRTRFYMDLDSGMKIAYIAAFREAIAEGRSDGFLVYSLKNCTNDERERRQREANERIAARAGVPVKNLTAKTIREIATDIIAERLDTPFRTPPSPELWIEHPMATKAEPERFVAAVTPVERFDRRREANLYRKASLAAVDRFFMRIRRFTSLFERPFGSGTNLGRIWHGYAAYDPSMYTRIGEIFRTYYNYCEKGKDGKTPAMRLGLAKGPVAAEKIIYFREQS